MRILKPMALSLTQRIFVWKQRCYMAVGVFHHFPFQAPDVALPEIPMWKGIGEAMPGRIPDEGLPKTRGEVLLAGKGFSRSGEPTPAFSVRLKVSRGEEDLVDKEVAVIGPRRWTATGASEPEPIRELPLTWAHAFGGEGFDANPAGMGFAAETDDAGTRCHRLPQLEDPRRLVGDPEDRPAPMCFEPLDPTLAERMGQMGTYDEAWLARDFPGFAGDLDDRYFQTAPPDQRIAGYWQGGEAIEVHNAHRQEALLRTTAPTLRARVLARRRDEEGWLDVPTRPETLLLLPNLRRGVMIHRGVLEIEEDDGADVALMCCALEARDEGKSLDHYRRAIDERLDPERGVYALVRDQDLLPARDPELPAFPDESLTLPGPEREGKLEERQRARAQQVLDQTRLQLQIAGLDPEEYLPELAPPPENPSLGELSAYMEKVEAEVKDERRKAEELELLMTEFQRRNCEIAGLDYDAVVAEARESGGGPPRFIADEELTKLRDLAQLGRNAGQPFTEIEAELDNPALREKLEAMGEQMLLAYRKLAHHYPPARVDDEARERLRTVVQAAADSDTSLAGRDLTGADLQALTLGPIDLREALLEGAHCDSADLRGARLQGAVLVRADLTGADLDGAQLEGANLGGATVRDASFAGADLREATLAGCDLGGACLEGADLTRADLTEARLTGARMAGFVAPEAVFLELDLSGCDLRGASLRKATFYKCTLAGARFDGAMLEEVCFFDTDARDASLDGAHLSKAKCVGDTSFRGASFRGVTAEMTNFRGADLRGAVFDEAQLGQSDLSEADARAASFVDVDAARSAFMRTELADADLTGANLMEALLTKARLDRTKLVRANLFRANLLQARGHETSFDGAHLARALFREQEDG